MMEGAFYPDYAIFHLPVLQAVEAQLLTTAALHGTEDAACLYGYVVRDLQGRYATWVLTAVPAICNATPVMVEILPETFQQARRYLEVRGITDQILVGWWHSQPGLGVHPSVEDENSMFTYFQRPWMLTVISDPCSGERTVYAWRGARDYAPLRYGILVGNPESYLNIRLARTKT